MTTDVDELFAAAKAVQANAHAPYSHFRVGAAVRTASGRVFAGCNVENAAYPQGSCAEAGAISAMVAAGENKIVAVLTVADGEAIGTCCGGCRQRLRSSPDGNTPSTQRPRRSSGHVHPGRASSAFVRPGTSERISALTTGMEQHELRQRAPRLRRRMLVGVRHRGVQQRRSGAAVHHPPHAQDGGGTSVGVTSGGSARCRTHRSRRHRSPPAPSSRSRTKTA